MNTVLLMLGLLIGSYIATSGTVQPTQGKTPTGSSQPQSGPVAFDGGGAVPWPTK